jgi:hypothetical protein
VEKDSEWGGVRSEDDQLADTAVEGLGSLVGTLLQLPVMCGLLYEVKDLLREGLRKSVYVLQTVRAKKLVILYHVQDQKIR